MADFSSTKRTATFEEWHEQLMDYADLRGLVIHKATLSHFKYGFIPRFTAREPNGRFKANKVGIFFIATH